MKFNKEVLIDLLEDDTDTAKTISVEYTGSSRWSRNYRRVFSFEGKFYETHYRVPATECQDESPYEYAQPEVECPEVFAKEKTVIVYEKAK
jgi:hypothetical protein